MKSNCLSYCKDTGKCNSRESSCFYKSMDNLNCKSKGVVPEIKNHDYYHNRARGE